MRRPKFRAWDVDPNYEISTDGRVFSKNYKNQGFKKELKQNIDADGYPYVMLFVNTTRFKKMVHRLVAELFLDKPSEKYQVNHKNGIRNDNRLENLEWVTHRENVIHGYRVNGRKHSEQHMKIISDNFKGEKNPRSKMTESAVAELRKLRNNGEPLRELAKKYNISVSQASAIASGTSWKG